MKARTTHDKTSSEIYNAVRTTSRALHILADILIISKVEKRITSRHTRRPRNSDGQSWESRHHIAGKNESFSSYFFIVHPSAIVY